MLKMREKQRIRNKGIFIKSRLDDDLLGKVTGGNGNTDDDITICCSCGASMTGPSDLVNDWYITHISDCRQD